MTDQDDPFAFLPEPQAPTDVRELIPDHVLDGLPEDATEYDAACVYGYHLIYEIRKPKTVKTARKRLLTNQQFLWRLADIEPAVFDEIMCAFAERALDFDRPFEPVKAVVVADQPHAHA